jgi:hypothetical protein
MQMGDGTRKADLKASGLFKPGMKNRSLFGV